MTDKDRVRERDQMVERQIRARGVRDPRVLAALRSTPRHRFVPASMEHRAYGDHAMGIGEGQTISQPYMVAVMSEALGLVGTERVLEVGTGSGYQCAVLASLAAEVYSVERIEGLAQEATARLEGLGYDNVTVCTADGTLGWPEAAPYQAILVTAGAPEAPPTLLGQLDPDGGRLVAPVGSRGLQRLVRVVRRGNEFEREEMLACRFVPLVGAEGWADDGA